MVGKKRRACEKIEEAIGWTVSVGVGRLAWSEVIYCSSKSVAASKHISSIKQGIMWSLPFEGRNAVSVLMPRLSMKRKWKDTGPAAFFPSSSPISALGSDLQASLPSRGNPLDTTTCNGITTVSWLCHAATIFLQKRFSCFALSFHHHHQLSTGTPDLKASSSLLCCGTLRRAFCGESPLIERPGRLYV